MPTQFNHKVQNSTRRAFLASAISAPALLRAGGSRRPNILLAVADDQSWVHTSAAGDKVVRTPGFDQVCSTGVHFTNAICCSPGCAPSRAAILTGRYPWQLEEAGTHASLFPRKLTVYPDLLAKAGYFVGLTGKGAGPCNFKTPGWPHNPAGPAFDNHSAINPPKGVGKEDYAANFEGFLKACGKGQPFCFWFGSHEPHRTYDRGIGARSGKKPEDVVVPPFLPDSLEVRNDILDYFFEIEYFDRQLARMLDTLAKEGELENTIVVVTADNGMSFPASKAMMHEYGIHMPLAIAWPAAAKGGRVSDDLVSFVDFAATFLDAAGVPTPKDLEGRSLTPALTAGKPHGRPFVLSGRERHSHARFDLLGYPVRALRTGRHLYVRNFAPDRWPAGDPPGYFDIDNGPTKEWMMAQRHASTVQKYFEAGFGKKPEEELFDIQADPGCMKNLGGEAGLQKVLGGLRKDLETRLREQGDPRVTGKGDIWESYPRFSPTRPELGGFSKEGEYNPKYKPGK